MPNDPPNEAPDKASGPILRVLSAAVATVILGAMGSGIWKMVAKPGFTRLGQLLFLVFTLGSNTLRDAAYSTAALDASPLPSILLLMALSGFSTAIGLEAGLIIYFPSHVLRARRERLLKKAVMRAVIFIVLTVPPIFILLPPCFIINHAVAIRRVYAANMQILDPVLKPEERLELNAKFAAMTTRAEYLAIYLRQRQIAISRGCRLRQETPF